MSKTKASAILSSMRLRTLPLSLSGVILGILLAAANFQLSPIAIVFLILTTISLQIVSNLSNELGDVVNGTDTAERMGPNYGLNSGALTTDEVKRLIICFVLLCMIFGVLMIWFAFGSLFSNKSLFLMLLGAAAIVGAVRYTLGKNPYGYRGWGDLSVFIFFGLVSVMGSYFVMAQTIDSWKILLPAITIGFFSVGVLNVNNIRDMKTDAVNRVTVAIKLGLKRARIYQTLLICIAWICMIVFSIISYTSVWNFLYLLTLPLYIIHLKGVWTKTDKDLDKMLPLLVMGTFVFAILAGIGYLF